MSAFPRGSLSPGSSTTTSTSTFVLDQPSRSLTSTTSTTTGAASENSQRVTFYLTSGLFPPLIFHAGDTLDCANLLASAAFHFFEKRVSPPMTTWILSKRAFQLSNGRWAVFLCSGHSTHEPAQAAVWVDAGTAWPHPYMIHVPCFAAWPQVKSRIFLPLDPDALVTVNGVLWDGSSHFFANGFVLQIRARSEHLISQSLLPFANRFSGLLALQCPCNGPATVGWQDLRPDTQRERFLCHFRERLNGFRPVSQCLDPFSHVLLYVQGSGVFRFSANTRLPARDVDVQHYFDRWLAGSVGDGIVQDLKFVWGECCLFVVRLADCEDTLWVHLDGDSIDFWELATSQDLSQIPTLDGQVLYPTEEAHLFGYAIRRPITEAAQAAEFPGPSRLQPARSSLYSSSAERHFRSSPGEEDDERLYELFGTPPEHSISSLDSSERAALAESVDSNPAGRSPSPAPPSSSEDSSATSSPVFGEAVALLQRFAQRTASTSVLETDAPDVRLDIEVFRPTGTPIRVNIGASDSFAAVSRQLATSDLSLLDCTFVPVYPSCDSHFQCIAVPASAENSRCPCLIFCTMPLMTQSVFVDNSSSAELLRIGLGLPVGLFWFAGSPWLGPSTALIPGMLLVFQPSPFQAVGETTPQFAVLEQPLDGFQAVKAANVACAPAEIHQIPTPLRRRPRDAQSGTANRVPICLADSTVPPATAFALGIESSMIRFSLEGHGSEQLSQDLPASQRITPRLQRVWEGLPVLTSMHPPDELFLFTDGSFDPLSGASGWSVVALTRQGNSFGKLGAAWGPTRHSTDSGGAFNAELEALLHAEAFANRIQSPVTHLLSDCSSALQVGCGFAATTPVDKIGRACIGLQILAASAGRSCRHHKVTAHADCIPNEIADALAKCAVFEASAFPCADCHCQFWDAVHEGALEWLWLTSRGSSPSLPFLNCDGGWSFAACSAATSTVPSSIGLTPPTAGPSCPFPFSLRILQYNCLSMKGSAAAALIAKGLHRQKIHFAGFQETRTPHDGIRQEGDFWVAASACNSRYQGGCQIWLHRKLSLATRDGLCHWDRKSTMIVRSSPRLLVLLVDVGPFKFACVSAHAFTSRASEEDIRSFWEGLSSVVGQLPKSCNVILCLDANARFVRSAAVAATLDSEPDGQNADCFKRFCIQHGLFASAQHTKSGAPLFSWTSPTGAKSLLDYVAVPVGWQVCSETIGNVPLGDMHEGLDHTPVVLHCTPTLEGRKLATRFHVPRGALDSASGQAALLRAWASAPDISWDVDATTHVACLHEHLQRSLSKDLTGPSAPPRNPVISAPTLDLIKSRRHVRRCERAVRQRFKREVLRFCFLSWCQHRSISGTDVAATSRLARRWFRLVLWFNERIGKALGRDRAEFFRKAVRQHHDAGPAQFAFFLRALTRQGRKFRPPAVLRPLCLPSGETLGRAALQDALGEHFAAAERAQAVDVATLLRDFNHRGVPAAPITASELPSLPALASGFAQLQRHRAPGLSGLPPDVFRQQPVLAALTVFPIVIKTFARGHVPAQYAGGLASTVPKPGKASDTPEGWRAILLLESDAKAFQKTMRPALLDALSVARAPAQFGGIPGMSLTLPSSLLRAHFLRLQAHHCSGGVVFVDVRTAYYSVVRDIICATPGQRYDPEWASNRAAFLFKDPTQQRQFVQRLQSGNPLAEFGASQATLSYVQAQLGSTWFVARPDADEVFATGTGTAPGAPIADTLFALVFRDFLLSVQDFLASLSVQVGTPSLSSHTGFSPSGGVALPTWADDTCVLFQVQQACQVNQAIAAIAQATEALLAPIGLKPNFSAGKTEAIAIYHGYGARRARQETLSQHIPVVRFLSGNGSQSEIRIVPQYPHLGSLVRGDLHEIPNLRAREQCMRTTFRPLKHKILTCGELSVKERTDLIRSRVYPRFLHQAGLWRLATAAEQRIALEAIRKINRAAFKPITGQSSQGLSNERIAAALGLPLAEELFDLERARTLCELAGKADSHTWDAFRQDSAWIGPAVASTARVLRQFSPGLFASSTPPVDDVLDAIRRSPGNVTRACKRFLSGRIQSRCAPSPCGNLDDPERSVAIVSDAEDDVPLTLLAGKHSCEACSAAFHSKQQLAVHRARAHKLFAAHTAAAVGTTCQVCLKEYWTPGRLQAHFKKMPNCRHIYDHADLDAEPAQGTHRSDPSRAWRPVVPVQGPRPFWATRQPEEG